MRPSIPALVLLVLRLCAPDASAAPQWTTAALSEPRYSAAAASMATKALFAGGSSGPLGDSTVVDAYDDRTGLWSVASLSSARWDLSATAVQGRAVFAGGVRWGGCTAAVDVYDLCREPVGTSFCGPAVPNSTGQSGRLAAEGCVLVEHDDVTLVAHDLPPNQAGYFLNARAPGSSQPPGSQGVRCLSGSIGRYSADVASSGDGGTLRLRLDLARTPTPSGPVSIAPGETWYFTAWYRDMNPGRTSNFTDGQVVSFE